MAGIHGMISSLYRISHFLIVVILIATPCSINADETEFQTEWAKAFGSQNNLAPSAEEYLATIVAGDSKDAEYLKLIQQLGSAEYNLRQQAEARLFSVPILPEKFRSIVEQSPDMEVRYRLRSIFENRTQRVESLLVAALRTIARQPKLKNLEHAFFLMAHSESTRIQREAAASVRALASNDFQQSFKKQLKSPNVEVRILAAELLAQCSTADMSPELIPLLNDESERVQLNVAQILIDQDHRPAVRVLAKLVAAKKIRVASKAVRILDAITGEELGRVSYSSPENNSKLRADWLAWCDANLDNAKLNLPISENLNSVSRLNGNTLIAKDSNVIIELDPDREEILKIKAPGILSVEKTEEGNYLAFSYSAQWLKEFSPEGKVNWEITGVKFNNAMPLDSGNVLVTVGPSSVVREIDPKTKKTVWEYKTESWPNDAYRLESGNTLIGGKGGVIEVSPDKEIVWEYANPDPGTIVVSKETPNGNILIGWTNGLARVVSRKQKVVWEHKSKTGLSDVFRDHSGSTFVAAATEIYELNADDETVWKYPKTGKTATIRR